MNESIHPGETVPSRLPAWWRRPWRLFRFGRQMPRDVVEEVAAGHSTPRKSASIDIADDDPLVGYFLTNPDVADVSRLRIDSPGLRSLQLAGVKIAIPLVSQGELIGLINLGRRLSEQEYSAYDRWLFENLAIQAAPAFRIAQMVRQQQAELQARERMEQQLRLARVIQQTLLPRAVPDLPGWSIATYYQPAWQVGGDFYDFISFPDGRQGIVIGDVTDKGIPSAIVMATTRSVLRAAAELYDSPARILRRANEVLYDDIPDNMFVTCLFLILEPQSGRVCYANAGHDLPLLRGSMGVSELRATGMPLGMMPGIEYEEMRSVLKPGEQVLFYSDGLVEAHNPEREMVGFPRVKAYIRDQPENLPLIDFLLDRLAGFTGPTWVQEDDVTLVTLERICSPDDATVASS